MATRSPIECPFCREEMGPDEVLEDHLVENHRKRKLAKFVVAELEALNGEDVSE